jgi:hypothetical protein
VVLHENNSLSFFLTYECCKSVHSVRGQSDFFFNLALMEKNMQVKFDLKLSVYSLVLNI